MTSNIKDAKFFLEAFPKDNNFDQE